MSPLGLIKHQPGTLLEMFADNGKVAECDISHMTGDQVQAIVALQDGMGRTCRQRTIKNFKYPEFDQGQEEDNGK